MECQADLKLNQISAIGNKIRSDSDKELLKKGMDGIEFLGFIPYDENLRSAEISGKTIIGASQKIDQAVAKIINNLSAS